MSPVHIKSKKSDEGAMKLSMGLCPHLNRSKGADLLSVAKRLTHRMAFPVDTFFTKEGAIRAQEAVKAYSKETGKSERFSWGIIVDMALYGLSLRNRERKSIKNKKK